MPAAGVVLPWPLPPLGAPPLVVTDEVVVLAAPVDDVRGVRPVDVGAVGAAAVVCRGAVGVDVAVDVAAALVVGERVVSGPRGGRPPPARELRHALARLPGAQMTREGSGQRRTL